MKPRGSVPNLRISASDINSPRPRTDPRYFVGLQLCQRSSAIYGALIRVWGRGLAISSDVVAGASCRDPRINSALDALRGHSSDAIVVQHRAALELTEHAAQVVGPLLERLTSDATGLRAVGLIGFGQWRQDLLGQCSFVTCCDTALLAKLTGLTIIDDFPSRDLAHGGRGGPCEAVGAWLLLSDRGLVPGRVIRALVDIDATTSLFLLPPREMGQLPPQLACYPVGPGMTLLNGIQQVLAPGLPGFHPRENLAVQGRHSPELLAHWNQSLPNLPIAWTPVEDDSARLLRPLIDSPQRPPGQLADLLCSAIHLIAERISQCVLEHLPRSQPVGHLLLGGPLAHHPFLVRQIRQALPEVEISAMDNLVATTESWRAPAAALLSALHLDQVPMNSATLTGADTPRVLGRITPGPPGNWHRVLSDLADTLPEKMTLRSAI